MSVGVGVGVVVDVGVFVSVHKGRVEICSVSIWLSPVCAHASISTQSYAHYASLCICLCFCVCMCVCVCEWVRRRPAFEICEVCGRVLNKRGRAAMCSMKACTCLHFILRGMWQCVRAATLTLVLNLHRLMHTNMCTRSHTRALLVSHTHKHNTYRTC